MEDETDKRRHPRHEVPLAGTLHSRGDTTPCQIRNISASGALIQVDVNLRPGHYVTVETPEIGKMGGRVVRVIWRHAGISLEEGNQEVEGFLVEWLKNQPENEPEDT